MKRVGNEQGSSTLLIVSIMLGIGLVSAIGFGLWAFMGRQDYKTNSDAKVSAAVEANTKAVQAEDAKQYAEAAKQPSKQYVGPEAFGSVHITYPRTWSAYVVTTGGQPLDAYFNPDYVPSAVDEKSVFALRAQVTSTKYSDSVSQYQTLQKQGQVTVKPFALPRTPSAIGVRIDGQLTTTKRGSLVILPLRDKSLKLWIESDQFLADFNNTILAKSSFSP